MKKLLFLAVIALVAVCQPVGTMAKGKEKALQLYSIRSVFGANNYQEKHAEVFKQLKQMGYTAVEAASYSNGKFYGVSPEQYKADLEAAGLKALSSHAGKKLSAEELASGDLTEALKWWDEAIAAHKAAGMKFIVTPSGGMPKTMQEAEVMCKYHNAIGQKCNAAGIRYGYHTHSYEFDKVGDVQWIKYMLDNVPAANMFWQMDVYWCVMAKESPVEWIKKYPGRFTLLHIKDKYEVGASGMVNYEAIFNQAALAGMKGYVIEMERTDGTIGIMEGVGLSAKYLDEHKFVKPCYCK